MNRVILVPRPSPYSVPEWSRSYFQAAHANNPMPWDRVGCHNEGIRRGRDHDDDSSSRNRQIVDDPA